MKQGYCQNCPRRYQCDNVDKCKRVSAELNRITKGRRKQIEIVYENNMTGTQQAAWNNAVYGAFYGDKTA